MNDSPPHDATGPFGPHAAEFWRGACARRAEKPVAAWSADERAEMADFNRRSGAGEAVLSNVERLADSDTLVVIAGQQAGLFVSPLYALYKAIAAVKWARRLSETLERTVIPAFWIASEDHDFDEVRHVHYLDQDGRPRRWTYAADATEPVPTGTSVFDVPSDESLLGSFLDDLDGATRETEFKAPLLDAWRARIAESDNLEDFYARGVMDLLGAQGLVLVPSRLGAIRRRAVGVLEREITRPGESTDRLRRVAETWRAEGRDVPIHRRGDEANFFLYHEGLRCKVTVESDGPEGAAQFVVWHPGSGSEIARATQQDLLDELRDSPEHFSPNVATRPVVQDAALPVLAMVGGPGEAAYLAQLAEAPIHDFFDAFASVVLPRPRAVLIEPRIERLCVKYGITDEQIGNEDWPGIEESFARSGKAGAAIEAMDRLRATGEKAFADLREELGALAENQTVANAIDKTAKSWAQNAGRLEGRIRREAEQGQETAQAHRRRLFDALRPDGHPQERVLGPLAPFLLNYGPEMVPWLVEKLDLDERGVQALRPGEQRP